MTRITDADVSFIINSKLSALKREKLSALTYQQIADTLLNTCWTDGMPAHLSGVAKDVFNLSVEQIVSYLTKRNADNHNDISNLTISENKGE